MPLSSAAPKLSWRPRVLVVDDEPVNRTVASQFCVLFGADADCAAGGAQAIACCTQQRYDLVLMDIRMPEMDGVQAARAIRQLPGSTADVPIVALTADVESGMEARCKAVGIDVVLQKPLNAATLFAVVQTAIDAPRPSKSCDRPSPGSANGEG